jgi:hypothetical protein
MVLRPSRQVSTWCHVSCYEIRQVVEYSHGFTKRFHSSLYLHVRFVMRWNLWAYIRTTNSVIEIPLGAVDTWSDDQDILSVRRALRSTESASGSSAPTNAVHISVSVWPSSLDSRLPSGSSAWRFSSVTVYEYIISYTCAVSRPKSRYKYERFPSFHPSRAQNSEDVECKATRVPIEAHDSVNRPAKSSEHVNLWAQIADDNEQLHVSSE